MKTAKSPIKKAISMTGYKIVKAEPDCIRRDDYTPYSPLPKAQRNIVDLETVADIAQTIPGMISRVSGQLIYTLCYFQNEGGDVVEIGSWQGRSASFLARATRESGNGAFYAIDHFKGNPGREHYYVVGKEDLSDLREGFVANVKRVGLSDCVNLLDMPNDRAREKLEGKTIRFLLIDGDHSKEGVEKDVNLFFPLLADGALVVFDDYSKRFPGLMEVVDGALSRNAGSKTLTYANTLVLKYKKPA